LERSRHAIQETVMKCPVCVDTDLVMSERQNVEIDYCPKCRGVWLDRGELDKIIERSTAEVAPAAAPPPAAAAQPAYGYEQRGGHHGGGKHGGGHRRKSWLQEIFD
jgi:uncharacterized protein